MKKLSFKSKLICWLVVFAGLTSCEKAIRNEGKANLSEKQTSEPALFTLLTPEQTQVNFNNQLTEGLNTNVMAYEYFYNGGGVAVGDVNGDGWEDIYFTGNMVSNKLYLNMGSSQPMQFKDITQEAGVTGRKTPWTTGVTMADVNGDKLLDIYVCYSGNVRPENRTNELYINQGADENGVPHFKEEAAAYGLAIPSTSTQSVFFDFDLDGDLDMFLLNHSPFPLPVLDEVSTGEYMKKENPINGSRLFRNDGNQFKDITLAAGISSSGLSYGLGVGVADFNNDSWADIYVSNDYSIPDYLYINNQDGTFTNQLHSSFGHTSHFSMGSDIADVNNDALPDIYTLDMLPEDNGRQKLLFAPDNYELFNLNLKVGFHYQYMRNMLQVHDGNGADGEPVFSEIGQMAGISNTDWSWSALFADYDNDGWKDLFVTNGYVRDYTNMDFMKYMGDFTHSKNGKLLRKDVLDLVHQMPSSNISNYIFKNNGADADGLTFSNYKSEWGITQTSNSNGAAYADLDNDGDLDLIVNNINKPAFIYQNEVDKQKQNNYLKIKLEGEGKNTNGVGAKVTLYSQGKKLFLEQMPTRGFQSSVSPIMHFGLGAITKLDRIEILWPGNKVQELTNVEANQLLTVSETEATPIKKSVEKINPFYTEVRAPLAFEHQQKNINDFKRQPLMVNPVSFDGPCMIKGDVNGDGLEDIFTGGSSGQVAQLYLQQSNGSFTKKSNNAFAADKKSEDVAATFFDANADGALDLYVCSGGYNDFFPEDAALQDRLYLNDGKGNFTKATNAIPQMVTSSSCVSSADINGDGFNDLFVGGRVIPGIYPETPESYILINDGKGNFKNATAELAPDLQKAGMITDAEWIDLNGDKVLDLIVVGEWMPVKAFINEGGKLLDKSSAYFEKEYSGWWNEILVEDLNNDGNPDLVLGNMGLNTQCKVSDNEPAELFYKDFDDNGSVDPIFCFYIQGESYPSVTRDELLDQMSMMRGRFPDYKSYANAKMEDIFSKEELEGVKHLEVNELKTLYLEGSNSGMFKEKALPLVVQSSPVCAIQLLDYNDDGNKDLLLCGNIHRGKLRFGNTDANMGILLKGDGKGNFEYVPQSESGFEIWGDVRSIVPLNNTLLFGINQGKTKAYQLNKEIL
ncbi:MAG: RNA-binding protein [Thalassobius sp.]|nr:RNA-binding protein [Thalassovita sp.]